MGLSHAAASCEVLANRLEGFVKPTLFLRIASILTFVHCVLHTFGGVLSSPRHGAEEVAVIEAMKSHSFDVMGSMRSYWDFFFGYALRHDLSTRGLSVVLAAGVIRKIEFHLDKSDGRVVFPDFRRDGRCGMEVFLPCAGDH